MRPSLLVANKSLWTIYLMLLDCGLFVQDSGLIFRDHPKDVTLYKFLSVSSQCLSQH